MRILMLTTYFRPDVASTGVIMSKLADEFVAQGHQVTVLTSVPHYDVNRQWPEYTGHAFFTENQGPLRIHRIYTRVAKDKSNLLQRALAYGSFNFLSVLRAVTLPSFDVILAPSPPLSNGVIADLISRMRGVPFVYNVQDIWPDVAIRAGLLKSSSIIRVLRIMEKYVYRRASGLAVISQGFRRNLLAKGVPDGKISVIPNFIDTGFITPQPKDNSFSRSHGLTDKFVVLFAGNMGFSQGLEFVIDAARILQSYSRIEFVLVGNGAGRKKAEDYLLSLKVTNVRFLPYQPEESLPAMYGAADVCLIPLRQGFSTESVPCKLFSIMAAGKAAIAAIDRGSDTWELLESAQAGIPVEPENPEALAEAILDYYFDEISRRQAGQNGRICAEVNFNSHNLSKRYLSTLRRATGIDSDRESSPSPQKIEGQEESW